MAGRSADHLVPAAGAEAFGRRLGSRLRARRLGLGRTLADVAREAGISTSYLSAVEKGANMPSLPVLARLVHALRLTLHELLREHDRVQVRAEQVEPGASGVSELHHPELRLRVAALRSDVGRRGPAPVPVAGCVVFVFIDSGALVVEVDGTPHALGAGDALDAVDAVDIRWQCIGETPALSLWGASSPRSRAR